MKIIKYILVFVAVFVLAFGLAMPFFGRMAWSGRVPVVGHGYMMPFGFLGGGLMGFGMLLFPLALLGLIVAGIVTWGRGRVTPADKQPPAGHPCIHCGKPLQEGWLACPYCGEKN